MADICGEKLLSLAMEALVWRTFGRGYICLAEGRKLGVDQLLQHLKSSEEAHQFASDWTAELCA